MTMIERVAAVIYLATKARCEDRAYCVTADECGCRGDAEKTARAAIAAMREPTEPLIYADHLPSGTDPAFVAPAVEAQGQGGRGVSEQPSDTPRIAMLRALGPAAVAMTDAVDTASGHMLNDIQREVLPPRILAALNAAGWAVVPKVATDSPMPPSMRTSTG